MIFGEAAFAQLSPYQGIINPYERNGGLGGSFGGVIIAEPDAIPAPLDNPAGLAFQRAPQVFAGMNLEFTKYVHEYRYHNFTETESDKSEFNPGMVAVSYPLTLLHREAALAVSLAKIPAPEFEAGYITKIDSFPDMNHNRSGNVGTATIGVSMKITPTLSIGLSYTHWLGSWKWEDNEITSPTHPVANKAGKGEFIYDGNYFSLGMIKQMNRFALGLVLQSPFTLMHAEDITYRLWNFAEVLDCEQQFKGAGAIGLSYRLGNHAKLGINYKYQKELKISLNRDYYQDNKLKKDTHKLLIGGEYNFHFQNLAIPVYIAYQRLWYEDFYDSSPGYMAVYLEDEYRIYAGVQMGVNCYYKSFGLHLAGGWQQYTIKVYNELFAPPSSMISTTSWFDVKKTEILINFGLSYYLK